MLRAWSKSLGKKWLYTSYRTAKRPQRQPSHPRLRLELLEDRTLLSNWADIAAAFNNNVVLIGQRSDQIANLGLGTARLPQLPIVRESLDRALSIAGKVGQPFQTQLVDRSLDEARQALLNAGFTIGRLETTADADHNYVRLSKSFSWDGQGTFFSFGDATGWDYFDRNTAGSLMGAAATITVRPIHFDVTFGVDDVNGVPKLFVADGTALTVEGVSVSIPISVPKNRDGRPLFNIGNLVSVDVTATGQLNLQGSLGLGNVHGDHKLRVEDFLPAQLPGTIRGVISGDASIQGTLTAKVPVLDSISWGGSFTATINTNNTPAVSTNVTLTPPDTLGALRNLVSGFFGSTDAFHILQPLGSLLNTTIPLIGRNLGDILGVDGIGRLLTQTVGFDPSKSFEEIRNFLSQYDVYLGSRANPVRDLPDLGNRISQLINGNKVDILEFHPPPGRWEKGLEAHVPIWGIEVPPIARAGVFADFGAKFLFEYEVGLGLDSTGFYVSSNTHIGVGGSLYAGLYGGVQVLGFDFAGVEGQIGIQAMARLGLYDPDPNSDGKIYFDEIFRPGENPVESFLSALYPTFSLSVTAHLKATISLFIASITVLDKSWEFPVARWAPSRPNFASKRALRLGNNQELDRNLASVDGSGTLLLNGTLDPNYVTLERGAGPNDVNVTWAGKGKKSFPGVQRVRFTGGPAGDRLVTKSGFNLPIEAHGGNGNNYFEAGDGNSSLYAGDGNSTLIGGAGRDLLAGGRGNNLLIAGDGDNTLVGGGGNSTLIGGIGHDLLIGGTAANANDSTTGHVYIQGGSGTSTLWAGGGDDTLVGGSGTAEIHDGRGNDLIIAGDGKADTGDVTGGGNDTIWAGNGNNTITGGSGNDLVYGGPQSTISFDNGQIKYTDCTAHTVFRGGTGNNTVYGGPNHDLLIAGSGNDSLHAGPGGDTLMPGRGEDWIYGGSGDDMIQLNFQANNGAVRHHITGGSGRKTLAIVTDTDHRYVKLTQSPTEPLNFTAHSYSQGTVQNGTAVFAGENASFTFDLPDNISVLSLIALVAHEYDDGRMGNREQLNQILKVDDNNRRGVELRGGFGNDVLIGGGGKTTLWGGTGNDTLIGGAGDTEFHGGQGDTTLIGDGDVFFGGLGNNTVWAGTNTHQILYGHSLAAGPRHRDEIHVAPDASGVLIGPGDRSDPNKPDNDAVIYAGHGNTLVTGIGENIIYSDGGNNIDATSGNNILYSSSSDDIVSGSDVRDNTLFMYTVPAGDADVRLFEMPDGLGNFNATLTINNGPGQQFPHLHQVKRFGIQGGNNGRQNITLDFHTADGRNPAQDEFLQSGVHLCTGNGTNTVSLRGLPIAVTVNNLSSSMLIYRLSAFLLPFGSGTNTITGGSDGRDTVIDGSAGNTTYEVDGALTGGAIRVLREPNPFGQPRLGIHVPNQPVIYLLPQNVGHLLIRGGGGDNSITLGPMGNYVFGDITVNGGPGNDIIDARAVTQNNVSLLGGEGNDTLFGGTGYDRLVGGRGDSFLYAGSGYNYLSGGRGHARMYLPFYSVPLILPVVDGGGNPDARVVLRVDQPRTFVAFARGLWDPLLQVYWRLPPGSNFGAYDLETHQPGTSIRYGTPQEDTQGLGFFTGRLYVDGQPIWSVTEFAIPTAGSAPNGVTVGPDGNIWFTEAFASKIGWVNRSSGLVTEMQLPPGRDPRGITAGPDGNLWFAIGNTNAIGRMTPAGGYAEFPVPTPNSYPFSIIVGPDGNLWFSENAGNKIGRITLDGTITEFPLPPSARGLYTITVGPDHNLWFTESRAANKIGRINPIGSDTQIQQSIRDFPIPTGDSLPVGIVAGPDGNLWFTEQIGNKIGRITPDGVVLNEFSVPTPNSQPFGITQGPDGNLWFSENAGNKIGRITPTGAVTEFPIPNTSPSQFLTVDASGNIWFAESQGNKIGRLILPPAATIRISGVPATITAGVPFNVTVTALDTAGNVAGSYRGIIHFTSSEGQAVLPADYTFTAADRGSHTLTVIWKTAGSQTLKIADTQISTLTATAVGGAVSAFAYSTSGVQFDDSIITGPDGNLWWTDAPNNQVWRMTPQGTDQRSFPVPGGPLGITVGPDGNLWITATSANQIVKMSLTGDILAQYAIPTPATHPTGITVGPDGNLWFTESDGFKLGSVTLNGSFSDTPRLVDGRGRLVRPGSVVTGLDGNVWFAAALDSGFNAFNQIGVFDPTLRTVRWLALPAGYDEPLFITRNVDGNIWFTSGRASRWAIGRVTYDEAMTLFDVSATVPYLRGITSGPDGNLWFPAGSQVGRIDPQGNVQVFPLPTELTSSWLITLGPDNNLWITAAGYVGRFNPATTVTPATAASFRLTVSDTSVTAGTPFSVTVTAVDAYGNVVPSYRGTVHFTSSDGTATLPDDYTFTADDNGVHTFTDAVTLFTTGNQVLTVQDIVGALTGSITVTVSAGGGGGGSGSGGGSGAVPPGDEAGEVVDSPNAAVIDSQVVPSPAWPQTTLTGTPRTKAVVPLLDAAAVEGFFAATQEANQRILFAPFKHPAFGSAEEGWDLGGDDGLSFSSRI
jgi:streptogramin lyase